MFTEQSPRGLPRPDGWREADELGRWLDGLGGWASFGTFTFGSRFGPEGPSADRALFHFRGWRAGLGVARPAQCFVAVEAGRLGRVHLHALLGELGGGVPRSAVWRSWFERFGRASITSFDPDRGATYYVAKYLTKAPLHWDIWGAEHQA